MDMIGKTILHYKIESRLGEGGMGVVYRATDNKLGRQVALKFLPAFVSQRPEEKERFLREARTASALDHPNISTIFEVNEAEGMIFYSMSLVEGLTLKDLRNRGPVTHKQIIEIGIQLADGLAHAHDRDVIHRDIKPQNIMVTSNGHAILLDFGLAKLGMQESMSGSTSTAGTAAYISPEQAQGQPALPQSDLFSLGVVMYELTCGSAPFTGDHPAALMYAIVHEEAPSLAERAPGAPEGLIRIIKKMMSTDPGDRHSSASELGEELRSLARDLEFSSHSGNVRTFKKRESQMSWRSVIVAGIAVLALGVWSAVMLDSGGQSAAPRAADRYDLAVMYFDDLTGSETSSNAGRMVTELLITGLSGSKDMKVLSSQRLYDILKQMGHGNREDIDRAVATDVARSAQARNMITGTIATVGNRTRLLANVINVSTGEVVIAESVEGTDLFSMVDTLTARVRRYMGVRGFQMSDAGTMVSVRDATTSSEEAYQHYLIGIDAYYQLDWQPALAHFDSAIALDSNFSIAYLRAGIASYSSNQVGRGQRYLLHGLRAVENGTLPPRESLMVSAFALMVDNNFRGAIAIFEEVITEFPDDKEAYFWAGNFMRGTGDTKGGIERMKQSLDLDPTYPFPLLELIAAYTDLNDIPSAIRMAERYLNVRPDEMQPRLKLADLYVRVGQFEQARNEYEAARETSPGSFRVAKSLVRYFARIGHTDSILGTLTPFLTDRSNPTELTAANDLLGASQFLDGQFQKSFATYAAVATLQREIGDSIAVAKHLLNMASRYLALGETDSAQTVFDRAYRIDDQNLRFSQIPFRVAALNGDMERARDIRDRLMERYAKVINESALKQARLGFDAQLAYIDGDYAEALKKMLLIRELSQDPDDYSLWIGRSYLEIGDAEKARAELEHSTVRYRPFSDNGYWLYSWYYLGQAHEGLGNRGDAVKAYRKFLHYWGKADRKLPEIKEARERLIELASAS